MVDNEWQSRKEARPILVTAAGICTRFSAEHPRKAPEPIDVSEAGRLMPVREMQLAKAAFPMAVTPLGMPTLASETQP
jgi:hypothetical protein